MNLRSTTHTWIAVALLVSACGGKAFTSEQSSEGVEEGDAGATSPGQPSAPAPSAPSDPGDDPGPGADPDPGQPGATDPGGDDVPPDPEPQPEPTDPTEPATEVCPADCPVIAICQLCDDGSCAAAKVNCNPDGSCGSVDWECPPGSSEPGPVEPEPVDPEPVDPEPVDPDPVDPDPVDPMDPSEYVPCEGLACGEPCEACPPGVVCVIGAGFCDAQGQCLPLEPTCESEPVCDCPIPRICQLCDDGSCATGVAECDEAGECKEVQWECTETPECESSDECGIPAVCVDCENGELWCPEATCKGGQCGSTPNLCPQSYEPCAGKDEGDACSMCSPLDKDCIETDEIKVCRDGECRSGDSG